MAGEGWGLGTVFVEHEHTPPVTPLPPGTFLSHLQVLNGSSALHSECENHRHLRQQRKVPELRTWVPFTLISSYRVTIYSMATLSPGADGHQIHVHVGRRDHLPPRSLKVKVLVAESSLTLCNPMDDSPPGSSVHGLLQARILEWVVIPFSRGSS